jgi:multidrug efflux pump subunit AcrB
MVPPRPRSFVQVPKLWRIRRRYRLAGTLGRDFFPTVDAGAFRLHVRAQTGTRIEETAKLIDEVEKAIREVIPPQELKGILDNIGLPVSGINLSYSDSGATGPADADIMVSLNAKHRPTDQYVRQLRLRLNRQFPGALLYFLPSDIVTQTINFGLPAPFDIQLVGRNVDDNRRVAAALAEKVRHVRGAVDVRVQQPGNLQRLAFDIDRTKASEMGLSERDIAGSILLGLAGSSQVQPGYWLDSRIGVVPRERARAGIPDGFARRSQVDADHRHAARHRSGPAPHEPRQCPPHQQLAHLLALQRDAGNRRLRRRERTRSRRRAR